MASCLVSGHVKIQISRTAVVHVLFGSEAKSQNGENKVGIVWDQGSEDNIYPRTERNRNLETIT
jgi:hypothetical protein